ncbi:MAG: PLP-dependent aminotransferase family protein [Lachnospiraceae bacterium]
MNEITINLNGKSSIPLYEQIYIHIKNEIQMGKIPCHEKLPSTRALAVYLDVSRSTVDLAYEQLLSEGYIEAVPCKGYYVLQIEDLYQLPREEIRPRKVIQKESLKYAYDFKPNSIDVKSFPYNAWRKLSKDILLDNQSDLFRLGHSQGEYGLREAISQYLYQARGVTCSAEQIIVGAGSDYLLMLLGTIIGRDHRIAFENPTYKQAYRLFENLEYSVHAIDMDQYGMNVNKLEELQIDLAYVMPSHQFPLGIVMPIKRRMELLQWAKEKKGRYIIEDDYDSEFRYKGKPVPALRGYDADDKVIYLGTFSRAIAPAIRMSYMVLPKPLLEKYQQKSRFLNSTVSKVDQMIVTRFIEEGYYERHLNKTRALYKSRHDTLLNELKPLFDRCRLSGENAGVHFLLTFFKQTESELIEQAAQKGVKVYGLSEYDIQPSEKKQATILLGFANMSEEKLKQAAAILKKIW